MTDVEPLPRCFFEGRATDIAPDLLNKVIEVGDRSGRIVEVEAYEGTDDPGSHGFRGITPRTEVMFGAAGHLYVYFTYGMHWCANVVCGPRGTCSALLLRGIEPLTGIDAMRAARPKARRPPDLTNGPAKLCQALGIDGDHNGVDVTDPLGAVIVGDGGTTPPANPVQTTRIGLSKGADLPWRWYVADTPYVSKP
ncbi:MAG: DNA-3-methyladenine glycosylase [Acidimicrobiales bacterium]